jgi:hypothetical protein
MERKKGGLTAEHFGQFSIITAFPWVTDGQRERRERGSEREKEIAREGERVRKSEIEREREREREKKKGKLFYTIFF